MTPDKPFQLKVSNKLKVSRKEQDEIDMFNRINAIKRIEFLVGGINLNEKNVFYLKALDLEMYQRWYKKLPARTEVDEDFCQRAAEVIRAMEGKNVSVDENIYEKNLNEFVVKKQEESNDNIELLSSRHIHQSQL